MKQQFAVFVIRWIFNSLGLWLAIRLLGSGSDFDNSPGVFGFLLAGLIFSVINSVIKPAVIILSLPAILLTLGLFVIIVNGLMVYLAVLITPGLNMSFLNSVLAGMLLSLINYIVNAFVELRRSPSI